MYHLRSNSGSNGPIAKECHRFLVAGPFKLSAALSRGRSGHCPQAGLVTNHSFTRRTTDSGASTSNSTAPSLYFRE